MPARLTAVGQVQSAHDSRRDRLEDSRGEISGERRCQQLIGDDGQARTLARTRDHAGTKLPPFDALPCRPYRPAVRTTSASDA